MEAGDDSEFGQLMRRFDAGDRSEELMSLLNRAAFKCFHAPWEKLPAPRQQPHEPPALRQGRLPIENHKGSCEDEEEDDEANAEHQNPRGEAIPRPESTPSPRIKPTLPMEPPTGPLDAIEKALTAIGHPGYYAHGHRLIVDLPFDPLADNQSRLAFRANEASRCVQMIGYGDLAIWGISEIELERACSVYNRHTTGLEAKTIRPREGARPRLRLIASIPFDLTKLLPALVGHLEGLLREERFFWRQIKRNFPF